MRISKAFLICSFIFCLLFVNASNYPIKYGYPDSAPFIFNEFFVLVGALILTPIDVPVLFLCRLATELGIDIGLMKNYFVRNILTGTFDFYIYCLVWKKVFKREKRSET